MSETTTQLILIDPQPCWEEWPAQDDEGYWCGRYRYSTGNGDYDVDVDAIKPPNNAIAPVEIDGKWYWKEVTPDAN